jgi:curved DNA-binding protein CbpA
MADLYNRLGVAPDASAEALRRAFRTRAREVHPDAHPGLAPPEREALQRRFIALAQAYETLRDPARRAAYDRRRAAVGGAAGGTVGGTATGAPGRRAQGRGARPEPRPQHGATPGAAHAAGADAAPPPGAESLDELLAEVEGLLGRFGVSLRPGFEALLEALLDWAREVFRQVTGAEAPPGPEPPRPRPGRAQAGTAQAQPRREGPAAPGAQQGARQDAAPDVSDALRNLRERLRREGSGAPAGAPDIEEELRRLKERLGRGN